MAAFDIIDASGRAYSLIYKERTYLYRLAAVPLAIKYICYLSLTGLGWDDNFIRQALVMLPSFLADGWMAAHLVRLILLDQRWPFRPTGSPEQDVPRLHDRAQGIMAAMILYTLIEFLTTGLLQFFYISGDALLQKEPQLESATPLFFVLFLFLIFFIWAFRFLWFYIAAAVRYPFRRLMHQIRGYSTSFYMIGTWLVCFVPVFFFFRFFIALLVPAEIESLQDIPLVAGFMVKFLISAMDTVVTLLVTAGITYGLKEMISRQTSA